jgi:prevent-host-death family protein
VVAEEDSAVGTLIGECDNDSIGEQGMAQINITDAKARFSQLLDRAAAGEEIVIARAGKPIARLVPYSHPRRKPGAWKGKIWISRDFDKEDKEIEALFYDSPIEPPLS